MNQRNYQVRCSYRSAARHCNSEYLKVVHFTVVWHNTCRNFDALPPASPTRCFPSTDLTPHASSLSPVGHTNDRPPIRLPAPPVHTICQSPWPVAIGTFRTTIGSPHIPSRSRGPEGDDRFFCANDIPPNVLAFLENGVGITSSENDSSAPIDYTTIWNTLLQHRSLRYYALITCRQFLTPLRSYLLLSIWQRSAASGPMRMNFCVHASTHAAESNALMYRELPNTPLQIPTHIL